VKSRWLATVALAGVVVAHALDFVVIYGGDAEREHGLVSTGHGYWPIAVLVGLLTGLVTLGWAAGRGGVRGLAGPTLAVHQRPVLGDGTRLAAAQVILFTALEVIERATAGTAAGALLRSPEFVVGVVLQVAVAALATLVLRGVERLSERVVRAALAVPRHPRCGGPRLLPARRESAPVARVAAPRLRGPPGISLP
jgi:hypothetical protein